MKKSWLIILSCLVLVLAILAGCGGNPTTTAPTTQAPATTAPATKPVQATTAAPTTQAPATTQVPTTYNGPSFNIRIAGGMPQGHAISASILDWKKKLEAATNGKVTVTFYEAGTMGKSAELYDLCLNGTVEAVHTAEFWAGGRFPVVEGMDSLPFTFTGIAQATQTVSALFDKGLLKELEPFKYLYYTSVGTINIFTAKTKISTMADFKGQKLRASGTNVKTVQALGGTALTVPGEEEYMDLDKGILTGNLTGPDNVVGRKEYEVLKYGILNPISMGGFYFIMNKKFWDSLPADLQAIINNLNKEVSAAHVTNQTKAQSDAWDFLKTKMEIYSIPDEEMAKWKVATSDVKNDWVATINSKGLAGNEIMNVIRTVTGAK